MNVTLREATVTDLDRLYEWRCDPDVYEHFKEQDEPLEWNGHVEWWNSRPDEREDYIIEYDDRPVGVVSIGTGGCVSVYVGETDVWGRGIGSSALRRYMDRTDRQRITAEIHEENDRSISLFESVGFEQVGRDGEWVQYRWNQ